MIIQVGCQVGESSLLSAAQLALIARVGEKVRFGEGCFGHHLLKEDPVKPLLQFGYGGRPPTRTVDKGFGVEVDQNVLSQWVERSVLIPG